MPTDAPHPSRRRPGESAADYDRRLVSVLTHLGNVAQAQRQGADVHADEKRAAAEWHRQHDADLATKRRAFLSQE